MKKKIRSIMLLIVVSMIVTSCGSADNDAGNNKKDDLSDVVKFEKFVETNSLPFYSPINEKENLYGLYTNVKLYKSEDGTYFTGPIFEDTNLEEYELENDKRYFTSLSIANDRIDDGSGNCIQYFATPKEIRENWNPDFKLLDDGIDDFIQYCQKNNIPYLLEKKKLSEEEIKELESEKLYATATVLLCISPNDFFQYELLPNLSYTIKLVDKQVDEKWDNFVKNHN